MNTKINKLKTKSGMTLTEIILAMALLAIAFIPIMGVLGTSIKATEKDNKTIRAVNICQKKMNKALQFKYEGLKASSTASIVYGATKEFTRRSASGTNSISITLGPGKDDEAGFHSILSIENLPITFSIPTYDPSKRYTHNSDGSTSEVSPSSWGWVNNTVNIPNMYQKYTVTVKWRDPGMNKDKFYTLVSYKANLRE
jgi:prepilin-type N-terminal cleavage/methylation domain-containing protein